MVLNFFGEEARLTDSLDPPPHTRTYTILYFDVKDSMCQEPSVWVKGWK